ncbi:hypothetical protein JIN85_11775 [Luteolibacter pohnpeiensis]|uniref:Uncharacterized protein n=1 Tax=Luteolibacter pohnpeiensis TaxID=454153 RepID=A0A934VX17_9BACT|nr:hypothetical protein [Luteolibacter pohnpeiensis]MBK1883099.1 hypothetical protein [Luteolibacter pohnpeiensis]
MKTLIIRITLVIFGAGLGFILVAGSSTSISKSLVSDQLPQSRRRNVVRASASAGTERKDLQCLIRNLREDRQKSDIRRELERMSPDELRSGMLELMEVRRKDGTSSTQFLFDEFGAELYRREGEAALEWAEMQDTVATRFYESAMCSILKAVAASSPSVLKRWVGRLPDNLQQAELSQHYTIAINSAAERGTDDWIKAAQLPIQFWQGASSYSDDFDFSRMLKEVPNGSGVNDALSYWAAQDKEAAWDSLKTIYDGGAQGEEFFLGSLWKGVASTEGSQPALDWVVSHLDQIPESSRESAIEGLAREVRNRPEDFGALLKALPKESDRVTVAEEALDLRSTPKQQKEVKAALNDLPRQEQMAALFKKAKSYAKLYQEVESKRAGLENLLGSSMDLFNLNADERAQVMAELNGSPSSTSP